MSQQCTLLGMVAEFDGAIAQISAFVSFLKKQNDKLEVSSLYRYQADSTKGFSGTRNQPFFEDQISVAIKTKINIEPLTFFYSLMEFEKEMNAKNFRSRSKVFYLAESDTAFMTPELTLPFTELHLSADLLIPAAEVYGQYFHPILQRTIFEITKSLKLPHGILFYEQKNKLIEV